MNLIAPSPEHRLVLPAIVLLLFLGGCGLFDDSRAKNSPDIEKVGIICSVTGQDAVSEASLKDAALMAIGQINDDGGLLGKKLEPVWKNAHSNVNNNANSTVDLLKQDSPTAIFGVWNEQAVKSIAPFLRLYSTLAFNTAPYVLDYGIANMVFLGSAPNQQVLPALAYLVQRNSGKTEKFYLLGNDDPYAHRVNRIILDQLAKWKVPPGNIKERYLPAEAGDYSSIVKEIKRFSAGKACVLSTLRGAANLSFYKEFASQGLSAAYCPVMSFTLSEEELRHLDTEFLAGHLAAKGYFQSSEADKNIRFVSDFKLYCAIRELPGGIDRVTNDGICSMYTAIQMWRKAVEKAGSFDPGSVKAALAAMEFSSPAGLVRMGPDGRYLQKKALVGETNPDGQFTVVWQSDSLLPPVTVKK